MALSTSVQGWIRIQSQHCILYVVLIEPATSLAKEQYTIYTTLKPPNEIRCLESTDSAPNKEPHLKLINPICLTCFFL